MNICAQSGATPQVTRGTQGRDLFFVFYLNIINIGYLAIFNLLCKVKIMPTSTK
jgi:hypothetical protein